MQGERTRYSNPIRFLVFVTAIVTFAIIKLDLSGQLYDEAGVWSEDAQTRQTQQNLLTFFYQYYNEQNMIATIILAAGEARRMGQPKQLMQLQGQSLLRRAVQTARSVSTEVIVVTGAYAADVRNDLQDCGVTLVHNPDWGSGMGSSLRSGVQHAIRLTPAPEALMVMLCDQPLVTEHLLQQLIQVHRQTGKPLVASAYQDTAGVPVLFGEALFPDLLALEGKAGAKQLIAQYAAQTATVAFPEGAYDVDTPEDFAKIKEKIG